MEKALNEMIIEYKREETKLKNSLNTMKDANSDDEKELKAQVAALEARIQEEQKKAEERVNAAKSEHKVEISDLNS